VPTFVLTKELYDKVRSQKVTGTRPAPDELLKKSENLIMPDEYDQIPGFKRSRK
jgi:hypothetical protein